MKSPRRPHTNYNWNFEVNLNPLWIFGLLAFLLLIHGEPDLIDALIHFLYGQ